MDYTFVALMNEFLSILMVYLFGRNFTKMEFSRFFGSSSQVMGIKCMEMSNGPERGVRIAEIRTGGGLEYIVAVDRGMDIAHAFYKDIPLAWISPSGITGPWFYDPRGYEWSRGFYGGMLVSCGYTYSGHPSVDGGEELGLHGRASYSPANLTSIEEKWIDDDFFMEISGEIREIKVFEPNVKLKRIIRSYGGRNIIEIEDIFSNEGFSSQPFQMLYHINLGFPLVDSTSSLAISSVFCAPRDKDAEVAVENFDKFSEPTPGFREQVFFHYVIPDENGYAHVLLSNYDLELGIHIKFSLGNVVDRMVQWKMMGTGMYVLGIEPSNCFVMGRKIERELGTLHYIAPGEHKHQKVILEVIDNANKLRKIANEIKSITKVPRPEIVDTKILAEKIKSGRFCELSEV